MKTITAPIFKPTTQLRVEAGIWLKQLRENRGISQREMAKSLNLEYYTFISQLENGRGRIPQNRYQEWANVLGVDPKHFAQNILAYYEPEIHHLLFSAEQNA